MNFSTFVNSVLSLPHLTESDKLNLALTKNQDYYNCLSKTVLVTYTRDNEMWIITDSDLVTGSGDTLDKALDNLSDNKLSSLIDLAMA